MFDCRVRRHSCCEKKRKSFSIYRHNYLPYISNALCRAKLSISRLTDGQSYTFVLYSSIYHLYRLMINFFLLQSAICIAKPSNAATALVRIEEKNSFSPQALNMKHFTTRLYLNCGEVMYECVAEYECLQPVNALHIYIHIYTKAFHNDKFDCDLNSSSLNVYGLYTGEGGSYSTYYTKKANCDRSKLFELQLHGSCSNIQKR